MSNIVPFKKPEPREDKDLYARACAHYLDFLDEEAKPPQMERVWERLHERHPDAYPEEGKLFILDKLRSATFGEMLSEKRLERLMYTMAARITAAEIGAQLGNRFAQELLIRDVKEASFKELVSGMKAGYDLVERVARVAGEEGEGKNQSAPVQIFIAAQETLAGLPPERRAILANELAREQLGLANCASEEVIDAD